MWAILKTHQIGNLIATKAWDFSVLSTAAVRGMHRRMVRTDHSFIGDRRGCEMNLVEARSDQPGTRDDVEYLA